MNVFGSRYAGHPTTLLPDTAGSVASVIDNDDPHGYGLFMLSRSVLRRSAAVVVVLSLSGCSTPALETGYEPRPLGASGTQRRGYYAGPFSREARQAEQVQLEAMRDARPTAR